VLSRKLGEHSDKTDTGRHLLSPFREDFQPISLTVPQSWEPPRGHGSVAVGGLGGWCMAGKVVLTRLAEKDFRVSRVVPLPI